VKPVCRLQFQPVSNEPISDVMSCAETAEICGCKIAKIADKRTYRVIQKHKNWFRPLALSNLNLFAILFHCLKEDMISNSSHIILSATL